MILIFWVSYYTWLFSFKLIKSDSFPKFLSQICHRLVNSRGRLSHMLIIMKLNHRYDRSTPRQLKTPATQPEELQEESDEDWAAVNRPISWSFGDSLRLSSRTQATEVDAERQPTQSCSCAGSQARVRDQFASSDRREHYVFQRASVRYRYT